MSLWSDFVHLFFTVNGKGLAITGFLLFIAETVITYGIIQKVPYTEIDWSTYMQQVECFVKKHELNYSKIEGDTGPIVYPGGHLIAYRMFYTLTNKGKDLRLGQYIFMFLYLVNLLSVFRLYWKSNKMPPFVLCLLTLTGYRIHSIFVLRMFNDPVAMMLFYIALNFLISQHWLLGALFYSAAFSIKMNIFLYTPALGCLLLLNKGIWWTIVYGAAAGVLQFYVGLPFLLHDPWSYIKRSFDIGRVFFFKWTVNWRFLSEDFFLNQYFHLTLLVTMLVLWLVFGFAMWFRTGVADTMFAMFTCNLIGIACARSLHYQFYSWYYHQLPFLLFFNYPAPADTKANFNVPWISIIWKVLVLLCVEWCWNTYPSTNASSLVLHLIHFGILAYLVYTRQMHIKRKNKVISKTLMLRTFVRPILQCRSQTSSSGTTEALLAQMRIFDRELKQKQRDWAVQQPNYVAATSLREEIGWRIADKVFDLTKVNERVLDIGCGTGFIAPHLIKENVRHLVQCDISEEMVKRSNGCLDEGVTVERVACDEETLASFAPASFDLLLSSLSAHWINDLPGWFRRCFSLLKEDCPFIGCMLMEDTLYELRCSLQLAELERLGGVGAHISPFVKANDVGSLLGKAGFELVTLDTDDVQIGFPNMFALLYDLQLMAESNCTYKRSSSIRRDVLLAAEAIYKSMYAKDDVYPATFRIVSWIGWKPGPNSPKPAKRGSQNASLKDISKMVEDPEYQKKLSEEHDKKKK
ncbi:unnamed protein product, partial [Mesorhabditis belari]|uniref:dolichyl-P-Man:Man5GlcNAc2-PP-dolichol alpha-1,3-mannosyltransferase n=1 Tax=Mesorhabditis belari TaxID=2138241 RepID=A0AAF3F2C6_9BILA